LALITTADQRMAKRPKVNIALFGPPGAGKTFQAGTLPEDDTLFVDLEAGMLSIEGWKGDSINIREKSNELGCHPWELARGIACLLAGPDPSVPDDNPYSRFMYERYAENICHPDDLAKYSTIFVDSITVASRMAFSWAKKQPEAFSEKTGKPDNRGAYGTLGQEMVTWLTQLQHIPEKSIVVVGILENIVDEFKRSTWQPQIEGSKAGRELPGIFDQVITLTLFDVDQHTQELVFAPEAGKHRVMVCHQNNGFGLPAKDRSTKLDNLEPPNLYALMQKIASGSRQNQAVLGMPDATPQQPQQQAVAQTPETQTETA